MRVFSPDGEPYDGEPVDCRELKQLHGYTDQHPEEIAELLEQARQKLVAEGKAAKAEGDAKAKAKAEADAADAKAKADAAKAPAKV